MSKRQRETIDQMLRQGAFDFLLDCASLDDALAWATRIPAATYGSIEVRPTLTGS